MKSKTKWMESDWSLVWCGLFSLGDSSVLFSRGACRCPRSPWMFSSSSSSSCTTCRRESSALPPSRTGPPVGRPGLCRASPDPVAASLESSRKWNLKRAVAAVLAVLQSCSVIESADYLSPAVLERCAPRTETASRVEGRGEGRMRVQWIPLNWDPDEVHF